MGAPTANAIGGGGGGKGAGGAGSKAEGSEKIGTFDHSLYKDVAVLGQGKTTNW